MCLAALACSLPIMTSLSPRHWPRSIYIACTRNVLESKLVCCIVGSPYKNTCRLHISSTLMKYEQRRPTRERPTTYVFFSNGVLHYTNNNSLWFFKLCYAHLIAHCPREVRMLLLNSWIFFAILRRSKAILLRVAYASPPSPSSYRPPLRRSPSPPRSALIGWPSSSGR